MARIALRPMTAEEFDTFRAWGLKDYIESTVRNVEVSEDVARPYCERQLASLLPDGLRSAGHVFHMVIDPETDERIGYLWYARRDHGVGDMAWLYNVYLEENVRGGGLGRELMLAFEDEVRALGLRRVELNVFGDNERARRLYASMGYAEMSRQLYKKLPGDTG